MKDREREALRKEILQILSKVQMHYTQIEKKTIATSMPFATSNTFRSQFYGYLLANGYVKRVSKGVYTLTDRGRKLLDILT